MITRHQVYRLKYNQLLIGPNKQVAQFLDYAGFIRGKPKRLELRMVPSGALESTHIDNVLNDWSVATPEQTETVNLLFNPFDDNF